MAGIALALKHIDKVYPNGVVANEDVQLEVFEGEIHALIGENGAGKSTLMKILFGVEQPTAGTIELFGSPVQIHGSSHAISLGIGMVHQHFMLADELTIAENLVLGSEPTKAGVFLDYKKISEQVTQFNEKYQFNLDIHRRIQDCSVGVKQKTEILKALMRGARILILDEPTAVLTPQEIVALFEQLRRLKSEGHTIIFISHKLNELVDLCDRVTIMRQGKTVATTEIAQTSVTEISNQMVGRTVSLKLEHPTEKDTCWEHSHPLLSLVNLTWFNQENQPVLRNLSFHLHPGEIVGVAGVEGNGQTELAECLAGILVPHGGSLSMEGEEIAWGNPAVIREKGLAYIPEDRLKNGCAPEMDVLSNLHVGLIGRAGGIQVGRFGTLPLKRLQQRAQKLIEEYEIRCDRMNRPIRMLSGGNIQKAIVAREILEGTRVLIASNPTRGIDIRASYLIRNRLLELKKQGVAILLISSDLNEVLEVSDRVIALYEGQIYAEFPTTKGLSEEELGYYMLGVKRQSQENGGVPHG